MIVRKIEIIIFYGTKIDLIKCKDTPVKISVQLNEICNSEKKEKN